MIVLDSDTGKYVIDPHYLSIIPFGKIMDDDDSLNKVIGTAKLLWIYHMYNPHSPFRDFSNGDKSHSIVEATFPKWFIEQEETSLVKRIEEIQLKNKSIEEFIADTAVDEKGEVVLSKKELGFVPKLKIYDPYNDELIVEAADWYRSHLQKTPLWQAYEAYKEAMYNLSKIISDPESNAASISSASKELDTIPLKMEKMRQQAIKDEASTLKVTGDKNIKRGEKIQNYKIRN